MANDAKVHWDDKEREREREKGTQRKYLAIFDSMSEICYQKSFVHEKMCRSAYHDNIIFAGSKKVRHHGGDAH